MAQTVTEVYSKLRPFIQRQINEAAGGGRRAEQTSSNQQAADYLLYVAGGVCYALDGRTGRVAFSGATHSTVIQAAIDAAGVDGAIVFRAGVYTIGTALAPLSGQTWSMNGAIFQPAGNNSILSFNVLDHFSMLGALRIEDPSALSTSVPAINAYSLRYVYIEYIFIDNFWRGMDLEGNLSGAGTNENSFRDLYMQVRDRGINMAGSCHDNHFGQVWIKGPSPTAWASGPGLRIATDGTQGGNSFDHIQILDMYWGMDLPGAYEVWFGSVIVDNALSIGIWTAGIEALFFDTIWSSSNGTGIQFGGNSSVLPVTYADKIHINKCYCWLNADYGVRVTGYSQQVIIGNLTVERNGKGLAIEGLANRDWNINSLYAYDNSEYDICGSGVERNFLIQTALFEKLIDVDMFSSFGGANIVTGLPTQAKGRATIANGNTSVTVSHGLEAAPVWVGVTGLHGEVRDAYVSAITPTQFTIAINAATTADRIVQWNAESLGPQDSNLVANWSVEDGTTTPTSWTNSGAGTTWETDDPTNGPSSVAQSGMKGLRLNVVASTAWWQSAVFLVEASATYNLRGFFKGTGSVETFLTIRWWSDVGGTVFISENNIVLATYSGFTLVEQDIAAPGTALSADIVFRCPSTTTADIYGDSFSVRKVY